MCDNLSGMEVLLLAKSFAHKDLIFFKINDELPRGWAKRTGIDEDLPIGSPPDAGPMCMAADEKTRLGPMGLQEILSAMRKLSPRFQNAKNTGRWPDRVGDESGEVFQTVFFGLVALRDVTRCAAMGDEQLVKRRRLRYDLVLEVLDELIGERGIPAPWHDVVVKNIAVGEEHVAVGQIERVNF